MYSQQLLIATHGKKEIEASKYLSFAPIVMKTVFWWYSLHSIELCSFEIDLFRPLLHFHFGNISSALFHFQSYRDEKLFWKIIIHLRLWILQDSSSATQAFRVSNSWMNECMNFIKAFKECNSWFFKKKAVANAT